MDFEPCKKPNDYLEMVARLSFLVDCELSAGEDKMIAVNEAPKEEVEEICWLVPRLISMTNVLGFLRGQGNRFLAYRPRGITGDEQDDLYADADFAEQRVQDIITKLIKMGYKQQLSKSLERYYVDFWIDAAEFNLGTGTEQNLELLEAGFIKSSKSKIMELSLDDLKELEEIE